MEAAFPVPDDEARSAVIDLYAAVGLPQPVVVVADGCRAEFINDELEYVGSRSWLGEMPPADQGWRDDGTVPHAVLAFLAAAAAAAPMKPYLSLAVVMSCAAAVVLLGFPRRPRSGDTMTSLGLLLVMALAGAGIRFLLGFLVGAAVDAMGMDPGSMPGSMPDAGRYIFVAEAASAVAISIVPAVLVPDMLRGALRDVRHLIGWRRHLSWAARSGMSKRFDALPSIRMWTCMQALSLDLGSAPVSRRRPNDRMEAISRAAVDGLLALADNGMDDAPLMAAKLARLRASCGPFRLYGGIAVLQRKEGDATPTIIYPRPGHGQPFPALRSA